MSVLGYFCKNRPKTRMPRTEGTDSDTGARYEGDVLTGKFSVDDALRRSAERARRSTGPVPSSMEEPDPVLRQHLHLDEPE
jgi:hypothetical protein